MIEFSTIIKIHRLNHEGLSIAKNASILNINRKTVKKYLENPNIERKIVKRQSKLDPFLNEIKRMLEITPNSSSVKVYKHLVELGFDGKSTIVKNFLRKIRGEFYGKSLLGDDGHYWMLRLVQGKVSCNEICDKFHGQLNSTDIRRLYDAILYKSLRHRNRSITVLSYLNNISQRSIAKFLFLSRKSVRGYIMKFTSGGIERLFDFTREGLKKSNDPKYIKPLFEVLHSPPTAFGINRTSWKMDDIHRIMKDEGLLISKDNIRKIIKDSGYKFRKAKKVLTSNDPEYRQKVDKIKDILSNLEPQEKFFSIDEFGPLAIKTHGGRSLVPRGEMKIIPQRQKSKGELIVTAALELSTNQITHFYSKSKNTSEMIKLLNILIDKYPDSKCIYFSWDAASWHASKELYKAVDRINRKKSKEERDSRIVKLVPLPSRAQFLNVIESVFSGMAKAIIHNSDYKSVYECQSAIDQYFAERNEKFLKNPKRAGKKYGAKKE